MDAKGQITNTRLVEKAHSDLVGGALGLTEPVLVGQATGWLIEQLNETKTELAQHRTVAVRQLRSDGWLLGAPLAITRARVEQIANG